MQRRSVIRLGLGTVLLGSTFSALAERFGNKLKARAASFETARQTSVGGHDSVNFQDILDYSVKLHDYKQLLNYSGRAKQVQITSALIEGSFLYDATATNTTNWCTRFAHKSGIGAWMRQFVGSVNVYWAGAKGDASEDDTNAFHIAFAASYFVTAPYGSFVVSGLCVPDGVRLEGGGRTQTTIMIRAMNKNTPMFRMGNRSAVVKLAASYPDQVTSGTPVLYAPTFTRAGGSLVYSTVQDILLLGSYDAFDHTGGYNGGNVIDQIYGFPLHSFVKLDNTLDVTRVTRFHLNPNFIQYAEDTKAWVFQNSTVLEFGRVDKATVHDFLTFGYGISVKLRAGLPEGSANMISIQNGLFDASRTQLIAENYQDGVFFTDVTFTSVSTYAGIKNMSIGLNVFGERDYPITFTGCSFRHFATDVFNVSGAIKVANSEFDNWNAIGGDSYGAAIKTIANNAIVDVGGNVTFNGRNNGNCRGISNDGTTSADITVIGARFKNIKDKDVFALTATLRVGQLAHSKGIIYNGVACEERNGGLVTFKSPAEFKLHGDFPVGTRFGQIAPAVGQPKGWIRTSTGPAWASEGNL